MFPAHNSLHRGDAQPNQHSDLQRQLQLSPPISARHKASQLPCQGLHKLGRISKRCSGPNALPPIKWRCLHHCKIVETVVGVPAPLLTSGDHHCNRNRIEGCSSKARQLPIPAKSCCSPFNIRDLDLAIHARRGKGAAGQDDNTTTFLKVLGRMAKTELLSIFNESFSKGVVSGIWKEATILLLKKQANRRRSSPIDLSASYPVLLR